MAHERTQRAHLRLDTVYGFGRHLVRVGIEITAATGEIAARHGANRGTATIALPSKHLLRNAQRFVQRRPVFCEQRARFVAHRLSNSINQRAQHLVNCCPGGDDDIYWRAFA